MHEEIKVKQPESGDLCSNITEFGVAEGDPIKCSKFEYLLGMLCGNLQQNIEN